MARRGYSARRGGHALIGNIWVPFSFSGSSKGDGEKMTKRERKEYEKRQEEERWLEREKRYIKEREEILPLVEELVTKLIEQNRDFESHINQFLEILNMLHKNLSCNKYITISMDKYAKRVNNEYYPDECSFGFTALDRTLENCGKNLPLFQVYVSTSENGDITFLRIMCAKVTSENKYSFKNEDGMFLTISGINESVSHVSYYANSHDMLSEDLEKTIATYEVVNGKKHHK